MWESLDLRRPVSYVKGIAEGGDVVEYLRLVLSRAARETTRVWPAHRMWIAFALPIVTVPLRGFFYGWTLKDVGFTAAVTLLAVAVLWGLTFLVELVRAPALIHNERQ